MLGPIHTLPLALGFGNLFDGPDLLIVLAIALIFFGNRLPGVAKSLGRSIFEFKKGLTETREELNKAANEEPPLEKPAIQAPSRKTPENPYQIKQVTNVSDEP
ncbi:MAG: Sec-independent protein translocase subunit TatA/TatB [Phycisphaerae bacterium]